MKKTYFEYEEEVTNSAGTWKVDETEQIGCGYCWDNRKKKNKELFFLDAANNMRICTYCPSCGRYLE